MLFCKLYLFVFNFSNNILISSICLSIILSLFLGALGALWQINVKQFFAYSAITNTGFILLSLISFSSIGGFSAIFYLIIYILTTLITFYSFIIIKPRQIKTSQVLLFDNFKCLFLVNPILLFLIAINFLSFAGIPPLPGFFTKFIILIVLYEEGKFKLIFLTLLISLLAAYYYIRPIKLIFFSMIVKPKFLSDLSFISVLFISSFFLFNILFAININLFLFFFDNFDNSIAYFYVYDYFLRVDLIDKIFSDYKNFFRVMFLNNNNLFLEKVE